MEQDLTTKGKLDPSAINTVQARNYEIMKLYKVEQKKSNLKKRGAPPNPISPLLYRLKIQSQVSKQFLQSSPITSDQHHNPPICA